MPRHGDPTHLFSKVKDTSDTTLGIICIRITVDSVQHASGTLLRVKPRNHAPHGKRDFPNECRSVCNGESQDARALGGWALFPKDMEAPVRSNAKEWRESSEASTSQKDECQGSPDRGTAEDHGGVGQAQGRVSKTNPGRMDWTEILAKNGTPEPPGYRETVEAMRAAGRIGKPKNEVKAEKKEQPEKQPKVVKAGPSSKARRRYV